MTPHDDLIRALEAEKLEEGDCGSNIAYNNAIANCIGIIRQHAAKEDDDISKALENGAKILAHFQRKDRPMENNKLEEWEACYARLFKQLNDAAQEIFRLKTQIEMAQQPVDLWQPIETAPKDGEFFLAIAALIPYVTAWCEEDGWFTFNNAYSIEEKIHGKPWQPTHWMPLPGLPTTESEG